MKKNRKNKVKKIDGEGSTIKKKEERKFCLGGGESEKKEKKKRTKSSLGARSQDRILVACRELRKLLFSNLLSAPMTTWPLVVVSPLLELLG